MSCVEAAELRRRVGPLRPQERHVAAVGEPSPQPPPIDERGDREHHAAAQVGVVRERVPGRLRVGEREVVHHDHGVVGNQVLKGGRGFQAVEHVHPLDAGKLGEQGADVVIGAALEDQDPARSARGERQTADDRWIVRGNPSEHGLPDG